MNLEQLACQFNPDQPVESASTPPAPWYVDPGFFELEQRRLLAHGWQPVGAASQIPKPGGYFSGRFAGKPYVVVRGANGNLHAFYNVCRHHGAELVAGAGCIEKFICPYHGWNYSLHGELIAAPRMQGAEQFDKSGFGLKPLPVCEVGPIIWLDFGMAGVAPKERFRQVWQRLGDTGYETLRFHSRRSYEIRCNWKVYVDNYLDGGYHVGALHKQLAAQLDLGTYRVELGKEYSIQSVKGKQSGRIGEMALYIWLYPNVMINRYGPAMDTNWVIPLAADRCLTIFDFYFSGTEASVDDAFIQKSLTTSEQVQQEDIRSCESVQRGLESGAYDAGRYAPKVEHAMHAFHRQLALDLRSTET